MNTPKFKEGEWIKRKKDGRVAQVVMLLNTCYSLRLADDDGWWLDYDSQDNWEITSNPNEESGSSETPKDLEEAAEISFDEAKTLTEDYLNFLAKGLKENHPRPIGPHWFCEYAKNRFIAGAKWQKAQSDKELSEKIASTYQLGLDEKEKQMLKNTVEGYISATNEVSAVLAVPKGDFKKGDKVKMILVKED